MAAQAIPKSVGVSNVITSQIQDLEEVYLVLNMYNGIVTPRLALVFSSEKTAQLVQKFFRGDLYPELNLPMSESKEKRSWCKDLTDWNLSLWGCNSFSTFLETLQHIVSIVGKKVSAEHAKEFEIITILPS